MKSRLLIVVATMVVLHVAAMLVQLKMKWLDLGSFIAGAVLYSSLAVVLWKTALRGSLPRPVFSFRALVVTTSLLFCAMSTNLVMQIGQKDIFGEIFVGDSSQEAYERQNGRTEAILGRNLNAEQAAVISIVERVSHMFFGVVMEEVAMHVIILGALALMLPPFWSVFLSSLIFALMHLVYPIALSQPLTMGLLRLLPTFAIGVFCGLAFLWYGLPSAGISRIS